MVEQTRRITYSALICAMVIVSTLWLKFPIPGTDMLFTTQVFFVLLCGQLLPPRYCLYTLLAYLALGLIGLPVFSATQGIAVITTPSFGYLLSFPLAAALVSCARSWLGENNAARLIASVLGMLVIYAIALGYIAALKGLYFAAPMPFSTLFQAYCLAFLPMDIVKAILAAFIGKRLEKPLKIT